MSNDRLRWSGNVQAQKEADEAFKRLKDKSKKASNNTAKKKKRKSKRRRRPDYHAYMKSRRWATKRKEAIGRASGKCEVCGSTYGIQVHHITYRRLGNEKPEDLKVLCKDCHANEHEDEGMFDRISQEFLAMAKTF